MCYSILVETDLKRLSLEFGADIDWESFLSVYKDRERGAANIHIPKAMDLNFEELDGDLANRARQMITSYNQAKVFELSKKLRDKSEEAEALAKKLEKKWYKTTQAKLDTTNRVIQKTRFRLAQLEAPFDPDSAEQARANTW